MIPVLLVPILSATLAALTIAAQYLTVAPEGGWLGDPIGGPYKPR